MLSTMHRSNQISFKKHVAIQSKLVVCNYLNVALEKFSLSYVCNNKEFDVNLSEPVKDVSRSSSTYELVQSSPSFDITSIKVNNIEMVNGKEVCTRLKAGILCRDSTLNVTFWLNSYEQVFKSKENQALTQYNIVFTPIFVFCSYMPYELSIEVLKNANSKPCLIRSHAISYLTRLNESSSNEITVKFDQVLDKNDQDQSLNRVDIQSNSASWHEKPRAKLLNKNNFNISYCNSKLRLVYANLFKYAAVNINSEQNNDLFNLNILTSNMTEGAKLGGSVQEVSSNEKIVSIGDERQLSEFEIIKKTCWPFSPTIRVDLKPICLFVNKTCYSLRMTEQFADTQLNYAINANGGYLFFY